MDFAPVSTPIETYSIRGIPLLVKREDLCWPYPPLSKARGVYAAIQRRPEAKVVGVVDTGRSLNGILVSTIGLTLGRKVVAGYPVYRSNPDQIPGSALRSKAMGVEVLGIPASRQFVMLDKMKRHLIANHPDSWYLLPTGLRLPETVCAVEQEALAVRRELGQVGTVVCPTGTGTHLAGLIRAFASTLLQPSLTRFIAVMGYTRREARFRSDLERAVGRPFCNAVTMIDRGFGYYEVRAKLLPPFPANLHYEVRAWQWLNDAGVIESLSQPILFWNVGA